MPENNKKLVNQIVLFVVVFAIAFFGTKYVVASFKAENSKLKKEALELNRRGPQLIDSETRLDSTTAWRLALNNLDPRSYNTGSFYSSSNVTENSSTHNRSWINVQVTLEKKL